MIPLYLYLNFDWLLPMNIREANSSWAMFKWYKNKLYSIFHHFPWFLLKGHSHKPTSCMLHISTVFTPLPPFIKWTHAQLWLLCHVKNCKLQKSPSLTHCLLWLKMLLLIIKTISRKGFFPSGSAKINIYLCPVLVLFWQMFRIEGQFVNSFFSIHYRKIFTCSLTCAFFF